MNDLQSHERGAFIRKIPSFKSGLHYLAQGPDGQVTQLKNLYPEIENELAELSNKTAQYALYVLRDDIPNFYQNCPQFLAFLKRE